MQKEVAVNLSFHTAICLEGMKSTNMDNRYSGRGLKQRPAAYKAGELPTLPLC